MFIFFIIYLLQYVYFNAYKSVIEAFKKHLYNVHKYKNNIN